MKLNKLGLRKHGDYCTKIQFFIVPNNGGFSFFGSQTIQENLYLKGVDQIGLVLHSMVRMLNDLMHMFLSGSSTFRMAHRLKMNVQDMSLLILSVGQSLQNEGWRSNLSLGFDRQRGDQQILGWICNTAQFLKLRIFFSIFEKILAQLSHVVFLHGDPMILSMKRFR